MATGFFYVLGTEGNTSNGRISGVPAECGGTIFMGFCKPAIRSDVKPKDWIIAISNAKIRPRWILSIIEVKSKPKLWRARKNFPEAIWSPTNPRGQIWVESVRKGNEIEYRYIPGAPHGESRKRHDLEQYPDTDTLIVGTSNSVIFGEQGIPVNNRILNIMRKDSTLKNTKIDPSAPFGKVRRKIKGENKKRWVCQGRPAPAIIDLNKRDIQFLKQLVKTASKKIPKTTQPPIEEQRGCRTSRRKMPHANSKRITC